MLKRFLKYYKPHIGLFIFDMLVAILVSVCNLFYPTIAKNIINEYIHDETIKRIVIWSLILLGIYLVKAACNYIMGYYGHVVGVRMQADMRRDLFEKYQRLPFSFFDDHKTGDLLTRISNDLFDVSELAHHGPENLLIGSLMFVGSFIMLGSINMHLTLIMFSIVPIIIVFTIISRRTISRVMKESRRKMSEINSGVENSIGGITETKSYAAEHHEICKFRQTNGMFRQLRERAMLAFGGFHAVIELLTDLLYLVIIFIGGVFLYNGEIDGGEFAAFLLYINMFLTPINRFVALYQQMQEGMSGFSRFHDIMDFNEEIDTGTVLIDDIKGDIEFENVTFGYEVEGDNKQYVIDDLSLSVKAGSTVALVGPSGGGKTTLCNLIPRFYNISSGRILLDGVDTRDIKLNSLRSAIGTVSQSVFLFDATVRENIAYGNLDATEDEIIAAAKKANIHDFITTLDKGYDTEVGERGVKLSGGQRQRIAIARVFL